MRLVKDNKGMRPGMPVQKWTRETVVSSSQKQGDLDVISFRATRVLHDTEQAGALALQALVRPGSSGELTNSSEPPREKRKQQQKRAAGSRHTPTRITSSMTTSQVPLSHLGFFKHAQLPGHA